MTNERNLSTTELIGIAQVYATLALSLEMAASNEASSGYSRRDLSGEAALARAKAGAVIEQAEMRGLDA